MAVNTDKDDEQGTGRLTPPVGGHLPFDGKGKSLKIGKEVNAFQLIQEVYERLGDRDAYEVVLADGDDEQFLHVLGDVDMRTVRGVVESHTPDDGYGLDEGEKEIQQLKERLRGGEDLSESDLNKIVRAML
jgi:hypothetical protein